MDESKVEEMFAELDGLLAGKPVKPEEKVIHSKLSVPAPSVTGSSVSSASHTYNANLKKKKAKYVSKKL